MPLKHIQLVLPDAAAQLHQVTVVMLEGVALVIENALICSSRSSFFSFFIALTNLMFALLTSIPLFAQYVLLNTYFLFTFVEILHGSLKALTGYFFIIRKK